MNQYVFILGREPALSVAEIKSVAVRLSVNIKWQTITPVYALVQADLPANFFKQLAGTVKLAQVLQTIETNPEALEKLAASILTELNLPQWYLGFSWYGAKPPHWLSRSGLKVKHLATEQGKRGRFVVSRDLALSSVVVSKNKLLPPQGCEFILLPNDKGQIMVARTLAVQEFEDWGKRDFGRPAFDARVGMLPPKLAHMMVNLAEVSISASILDPFCGSGTVLQEAAVLDYKNLCGTDMDAKGINRTRDNLAWLRQQYPDLKVEPHLLVSDVRQLSSTLNNQSFGAIVTEPYLGPPLTGKESEDKLHHIQTELTDFYRGAIKSLSYLLDPGGSLVMIWPQIHWGKNILKLEALDVLNKLDLSIKKVLPSEAPSAWTSDRGSLIYKRPDQHIAREIFVFIKK